MSTFFCEKIYEKYDDVFEFFEILPVKNGELTDKQAFLVSGSIIRIFELMFVMDDIFLDGWIEVNISIVQWKKCLERCKEFLDCECFEDALKILDKESNCSYDKEYNLKRQYLMCSESFIKEEKEELKRTVSQLLEWTELHENEFDSLSVSDFLQ